MKFVDETTIEVIAGKGGDGCLSFRREKFIPFGGPNGGDGGHGGNIYLVSDEGLNTLVDFRFKRLFRAQHGKAGAGKQRSGKSGQDLLITVPVGTLVFDADTDELLGDLTQAPQRLLVAQGGQGGLGNVHFKSSTNRAPRRITLGRPGENRRLRLELQVLADVGLLGLPNAGKSTFIGAVSAARPKVADYPFTTLQPHLGVVSLGVDQSFVIADIPGLISGAATGAGLGIQFLKHLSRTQLLLHIVDIRSSERLADVNSIIHELEHYSPELAARERWLVFNKIDSVSEAEQQACRAQMVKAFNGSKPMFFISALTGQGCQQLCYSIMQYFTEKKQKLE